MDKLVREMKRTRKRLGMSQEAVARWLNVALMTVAKWEQGRRRPTGLCRLALEKWVVEHSGGKK